MPLNKINIKSLKPGDLCLIGDQIVQISEVNIIQTGKHGKPKVNITGTDLLTDKKFESVFNSPSKVSSINFKVVSLKNDQLELSNVLDGTVSNFDLSKFKNPELLSKAEDQIYVGELVSIVHFNNSIAPAGLGLACDLI